MINDTETWQHQLPRVGYLLCTEYRVHDMGIWFVSRSSAFRLSACRNGMKFADDSE